MGQEKPVSKLEKYTGTTKPAESSLAISGGGGVPHNLSHDPAACNHPRFLVRMPPEACSHHQGPAVYSRVQLYPRPVYTVVPRRPCGPLQGWSQALCRFHGSSLHTVCWERLPPAHPLAVLLRFLFVFYLFLNFLFGSQDEKPGRENQRDS